MQCSGRCIDSKPLVWIPAISNYLLVETHLIPPKLLYEKFTRKASTLLSFGEASVRFIKNNFGSKK